MKGRFFRSKVHFVEDDLHTLCIGATRSGKSRTVVLPTIATLAFAGENMCISDPKGELHAYTAHMLKEQGYHVIALDYRHPKKSAKYNFLQEIINEVKRGDLSKASRLAIDMAEALVGESKGEKIWPEGEKSILSSVIIAVVYDNIDNPQFQNMANVYYFICEMCKMGENMLLEKYIEALDYDHPARSLLAASGVAPSKTRGSFYTGALATLRLFVDRYIYNISNESDFTFEQIAKEKTALFIILPDEKSTYYGLASFFMDNLYCKLVEIADERGGRLEKRFNFILDEFGNFAPIPDFSTKLTVGAGRGIRINIFVQGVEQITAKYSEEVSQTIMGNCSVWIYLSSSDGKTKQIISQRLGEYTCSSQSRSASDNGNLLSGGNLSASSNLIARKLLTEDEIGRIKRPYQLVMSLDFPAVMYSPDLKKTMFNKILGLGSKEYNRKFREFFEKQRPERSKDTKMELWCIWEQYQNQHSAKSNNQRPRSAAPSMPPISNEIKIGRIGIFNE
jgi:type IV secretion system protein VirD4